MKKSQELLNSLYESLENATTVSISGQQIQNSALKAERSFNAFNEVLAKTLNESHDDGLNAWANEVVTSTDVNDKVLVNFNSVMERLQTESEDLQNAVAASTYDDLEYLTNLDGNGLVSAITNGALKDYGWVPEFEELNLMLTENKGLKGSTNLSENTVMYSPFSMICENNESGLPVVRIKNKNYAIGKTGRLFEAEASAEADAVNNAIENILYNDEKDQWELESPVGMITISPYEKCIRLNGDSMSCEELKESLSDAVKSEDSVLTLQDTELLDDVIHIVDNIDDIAILDQVTIFENLVDRTNLVIYPNESGTEVSVIEDGEVKYADNFEDVIEYAHEEFNASKAKLNEVYSKQLKAKALFESKLNEENEIDSETKEELEKSLLEVDEELALVDADSEAAEALIEVRNTIVSELGKLN
ncbi:gp111 [Sphingomonas phage PAU]|uniref:gp111 n=1 Tax=Sphingomonas phage PAU TaxID=1150991 RepID=UPI0002573262|nr:gp111 [Sphingomonas phage PAU]AFF28109.1 gp111 [Sphingomonas phage PAU]